MSGHANYGSSETVAGVGAGVRQWKRVAFVENDESAAWGVTCSIDDPAFAFAVQFRIRWGNGGVQHEVTLNAFNGFTLSVDGDTVQVDASLDGNVGQSAVASASVSDVDPGKAQPLAAVLVGGTLPGATSQLTLPAFTKAVQVIPLNITVAGYAFSVSEATWQQNYAPNEKMELTPVTTDLLLIINNEPVDTVNYVVFCQLSI